MANKDLQLEPYRITRNGTVRDDVIIYEDREGLWVYSEGEEGVTLTWARIRAALKRKDK